MVASLTIKNLVVSHKANSKHKEITQSLNREVVQKCAKCQKNKKQSKYDQHDWL